jgi:ABC-type antimicrobial peptide transport system permease subunit
LTFALDENLFDLKHILSYMPLALLLTLVAGILPAINITRIQPVESLRYE